MPQLVKDIHASLKWDTLTAKYYHPWSIDSYGYIIGDFHNPKAAYSHNVALDMLNNIRNDEYVSKLYDDTEKLLHNYNCRFSRLRSKISDMVSSGDCVFATLTWRDEYLSISESSRKQYVVRWLKSFGVPYIANIDYGSATEREHYHAVLQLSSITKGSWPYGFDYYRRIRSGGATEPKSVGKVARYINKLALHASKVSTKQNKIIYSRSVLK